MQDRYWTVDDWKTVIFSDETKINRFGPMESRGRGTKTAKPTSEGDNETWRGTFDALGCITSRESLHVMKAAQWTNVVTAKFLNSFANTLTYHSNKDKMALTSTTTKHTAKSVSKYLSNKNFAHDDMANLQPEHDRKLLVLLKNKVSRTKSPPNGSKELFTRVEKDGKNRRRRPPSADACKFLAAAMVLRKFGRRIVRLWKRRCGPHRFHLRCMTRSLTGRLLRGRISRPG